MKSHMQRSRVFMCVFAVLVISCWCNRAVGQVTPYSSDANTILLDHFNGATSATISAYNYNGAPTGTAYPSATPSYSYGQGPNGLDQELTLYPPAGTPTGSATYFYYPGGQLLSQANGTIEFWVYIPSFSNGLALVEQGQYYNASYGWTFGMGVDSTGQLNANAWAAFSMNSGTTRVPPNTWTHVAATWGSSGAKLYINGVQVGSDANTGMPASGYSGSVLVRLGTYAVSGVKIDELRISNIQRTSFNTMPYGPKVVTIPQLQQVPFDSLAKLDALQDDANGFDLDKSSYWHLSNDAADTVQVTGVVIVKPRVLTYTQARYNIFIQDTTTGQVWGGLDVLTNDTSAQAQSTGITALDTGMVVTITGRVTEYGSQNNSVTELLHYSASSPLYTTPSAIVVGSTLPARPAPREITLDSLELGNVPQPSRGEKYESMYVIIRDVTVATVDPTSGRFTFEDAAGNIGYMFDGSGWFTLRGHRLSASTYTLPSVGAKLNFLRGIVLPQIRTGTCGDYAIMPLYPGDMSIGGPPAAPTGVMATAGNGQATIRWNRNTESDFLEYFIYRGTTSGGEVLVDSATGGIADTVKTFTGLANGTEYFFEVTALNTAGQESPFSNEVTATPQIPYATFTQAVNNLGITDTLGFMGFAWGDYNNDGYLDLYRPGAGYPSRLYKNLGTSFSPVSIGGDTAGTNGAVWADFDGDGNLDLLMTSGSTLRLYKGNGTDTFTDITSASNLPSFTASNNISIASVADFNKDGNLEVAFAGGVGAPGPVNLLQSTSGVFSNVASSKLSSNGTYESWNPAWVDVNNDGNIDLWIPTIRTSGFPCALYINNGTTLSLSGSSGITAASAIISAWGDYDNDGYMDLFLIPYTGDNDGVAKLYHNNGNGTFTDVAASMGLNQVFGDVRGVCWGDYDNDGNADLLMTQTDGQQLLWRNTGSSFVEVGGPAGIGVYVSQIRSCAFVDYDNDGFLDIFLTSNFGPKFLFRNNGGNGNHWIGIKLIGSGNNKSAIGARVKIAYGANSQIRDIQAGGTGGMANGNLWANFGLGGTTTVDSVTILWPTGQSETFKNPAVDHYNTLVKGTSGLPPVITSFTPASGTVGTSVTIDGSNFNSNPSNNQVYFGGVSAAVTVASPTSLTVTVPVGASCGAISVTDTISHLTAFSLKQFTTTFLSSQVVDTSSFGAKVDFATAVAPYWSVVADFDGDGKPDVAVGNAGNNSVSILRNTSTSGTITTGSFAAKVDFTTGTTPHGIAVGDLDGDGKLDFVAPNWQSSTISVFRNTSTTGAINSASFAAKVDFTAGTNPSTVSIADLDGDGRPDLIVPNYGSNTVSVYRNIGTGGSVTTGTFAGKVDFIAGSGPMEAVVADLDGDGKPDMAVTNKLANTVSVFRNTSTTGTMSFSSKVDLTLGSGPYGVVAADMDGDGKLDLVVTNSGSNTVSVLRNVSTSGTITTASFSTRVDFATGSAPADMAVADLDGDGRLDLAVANTNSNTVSVFRNSGTSGSITSGSFASKVDFATAAVPFAVAVNDLDGDGKPDIVVTENGSTSISVYRNTIKVPSVISFGVDMSKQVALGLLQSNDTVMVRTFTGVSRNKILTAVSGTSIYRDTVNFGSVTGPIEYKFWKSRGVTDGIRYENAVGPVAPYGNRVDTAAAGLKTMPTAFFNNDSVIAIGSVSPQSGAVGSSVTLTGFRFNSNASINIVRFGPVKASVTTASTTSLTVTVPAGASYSPIAVTDTVAHLTGYGPVPFRTTFLSSRTISSGSFASKVDFAAGTNPYGLAIADVDGDGKSDIIATNYNGPATVSVFRNTSSSGTVDAASFAGKVDFATGSLPWCVAAGDLDGDGKTDLVVANNASNTISVFRNTSTVGNITSGSFAASVDFTTGTNPWGVAIADVDGDGKPDIIVTNNGSASVSVFRNTSSPGSITSGSFATKVDFTTGTSPMGVAVADIDGDMKPDLVVANSVSNTLSLLMNLSSLGTFGTGSFGAKVDFTTGSAPMGVAVGDLDGDGKADVVVANYSNSSVSVLRNTSTIGTIDVSSLATRVDFTAGTNPTFVALGDADGDGKVDVAVTNYASGTVSMFKNTSTAGSFTSGSLAAQVTYFTASGPHGMGFSDLDGDGKPDLAVANTSVTSNSVSVLRNLVPPPPPPMINTFSPTSGVAGTSMTIAGANFNTVAAANKVIFGSVKASVLSATATLLNVTIPIGALYSHISVTDTTTGLTGYSNQAFVPTFQSNQIIDASSFAPESDITTSASPWSVQAADIDGDGKSDLVVANDGANSISIFRNTSTAGAITFASKLDSVIGQQPKYVVCGDLDGDGKPDIVTANQNGNTLSIYRNLSSPALISLAPRIALADTGGPFSAALSDLDGDGRPDILVANIDAGKVSVLRNSSTVGTLSFAAPSYFTASSGASSVAAGDIDGDGLPDVVVANSAANSITILRNTSTTGNISLVVSNEYGIDPGAFPWTVKLADLDLDGKLDIILINTSTNRLSVFRNQSSIGAISFNAREDQLADNAGPWSVTLSDVNGDAKPDVIVGYQNAANISVFKNTSVQGSVTFATRVDFSTTGNSWGVIGADFDGDGKPDLAATNNNSSTISILRNIITDAPFAPTNLTATTASSSQINLSWTASSYGSPTMYRIYRSTTSGSGFTRIDSVSGSTTTYASTGLSANTTYYYLVYAVNASGQSAASNQASSKTSIAVPSAPTNLTATAASISQINLSWTASTSGSPTLYRIYRSFTPGTGFSQIDSVSGSTTTYANTGLTDNTAYYYLVYAVNEGGQSAASNQAGAVTSMTVPSAPTNLTATAVSSSQINLSWTASTSGSPILYRIYRSLTLGTVFDKIDSVNGSNLTYANTGLSAGTTYYYLVYAVNSGGQSAASNQASAATPPNATISVVTPPSNWATTYTYGISWSSQNLPGSVNIKLSLDNGGTFPTTIAYAISNSGSYTWNVPSTQSLSNTCVLRVESYDYPGIYGLSNKFAIVNGGNVTFSQPATVTATYSSNPSNNNEYRLISFPGRTDGMSVGQLGFSGNQDQDWKMFREPGSGPFIMLNGSDPLKTGEGYWYIQRGSLSISVSFNTPTLNNDATVSIALSGGQYSIIGNPFNVSIPWSSVLAMNGLLSGTPLFSWNGSWSSSNTSLQPGVGYYINSTGLSMLKIPYASFGFPSQVAGDTLVPDWRLQVAYESETNKDDDNYIGIAKGTKVGKDRFEFNKPPLIFDESFVYMKRPTWDSQNDKFYADYRPEVGDGQTWELEITNPSKSLGNLRIIGIDSVPGSYDVYLVNEELGLTCNLRKHNSMQYGYGRTTGHFKVVVGPHDYVTRQLKQYMPTEFSLEQNFPNPFNPSTTIMFKLPQTSPVRIEVYSILGQEIRVLAEGEYEAGVHQVVWSGVDAWGKKVASGMYLCRLTAGKNIVQTKKMLLIK